MINSEFHPWMPVSGCWMGVPQTYPYAAYIQIHFHSLFTNSMWTTEIYLINIYFMNNNCLQLNYYSYMIYSKQHKNKLVMIV